MHHKELRIRERNYKSQIYRPRTHKDREKPFIVHSIPTLRQSLTEVIVSTAAILGLRVFTHGVSQTYLQIKDKLTRLIYLKPKVEDRNFFNLGSDDVLQLLKPLYVICDAGHY